MSEPRTEAGKALLDKVGPEAPRRGSYHFESVIRAEFAADINAIEEQAATEVRRELLAKVEGLRPSDFPEPRTNEPIRDWDSFHVGVGNGMASMQLRILALLAPSEKGARG